MDLRHPHALRLVALLAMGAAVAWGWDALFFAPLRVLVVVFHELGHALATWVTGGEVVEIAVDLRGGGHTLSRGGAPLVILNAGYLGSLAAGLVILEGAERAARVTAVLLAMTLVVTVAQMSLSFGFVFTGAIGLLLLAFGWSAPEVPLRWGLRMLGVFVAVYAIVDARVDAKAGDAELLAARTSVPPWAWTAIWWVGGAIVLALWARHQLRRSRAAPTSEVAPAREGTAR